MKPVSILGLVCKPQIWIIVEFSYEHLGLLLSGTKQLGRLIAKNMEYTNYLFHSLRSGCAYTHIHRYVHTKHAWYACALHTGSYPHIHTYIHICRCTCMTYHMSTVNINTECKSVYAVRTLPFSRTECSETLIEANLKCSIPLFQVSIHLHFTFIPSAYIRKAMLVVCWSCT